MPDQASSMNSCESAYSSVLKRIAEASAAIAADAKLVEGYLQKFIASGTITRLPSFKGGNGAADSDAHPAFRVWLTHMIRIMAA